MPVIGLGLQTVLVTKPNPPAATKKSKTAAGFTLAADVVAVVAQAHARPTAAPAIALGADVVIAHGTMVLASGAATTLKPDVFFALADTHAFTVAFPSVQLGPDVVHATAAMSIATTGVLTLAGDVVAAAGLMHQTGAGSVALAGDRVTAAAAGFGTSAGTSSLTLADDRVAAVAFPWVHGSANIQLFGDFPVSAFGVPDVADGSAALVLRDDVIVTSTTAHGSPSSGSSSTHLADDLVAVSVVSTTPVPATIDQIRQAVHARLAASLEVVAFVGSRIYFGAIPQSAGKLTTPALSFQVVTRTYGHVLQGGDGSSIARVQISAWSTKEDTSDHLGQVIRNRFDGFRGVIGNVEILSSLFDNETDIPHPPMASSDQWVYEVACDYMMLHRVSIPSSLGV